MTETPVPDAAAVQIAAGALRALDVHVPAPVFLAVTVVAALAREGWLTPPDEVAGLRAVAEAARGALDVDPTAGSEQAARHMRLEAALDALPPAGHEPAPAQGEDVERLRARVDELEGELAAAESTIRVLEDPELREALSTPTTGDYGPVPHPDAVPAGPQPAGETEGRER